MFSACQTFGPFTTSNCTAWPSWRFFEAARDDGGVVRKYVSAVLPADEAKPLGIVKPVPCSIVLLQRRIFRLAH